MIDWSSLGIAPAAFLLPRQQDLNRFWPVIACDQYTVLRISRMLFTFRLPSYLLVLIRRIMTGK